MLDKLRDIAIRFQIDPDTTVGHAAKVITVIRVLTEMNKSFSNFLDVEFLKNDDFKDIYSKNNKVLDTIKDDLELLIVVLVEELKHDTSPFKPNIVKFDNFIYVLTEKLLCVVEYEDDCYTIKNESLDICVWGDTREEVEIAFAFSFHALYENFALETDDKLSAASKELKNKLLKLVKSVVHEA